MTAGIFDGPDSKAIVPVRAETTMVPQALFLMNNTLTVDTAKRLAEQLMHDPRLTDANDWNAFGCWAWAGLSHRKKRRSRNCLSCGVFRERFYQAPLGTNEFAYLD